jgi:hypothetical protein
MHTLGSAPMRNWRSCRLRHGGQTWQRTLPRQRRLLLPQRVRPCRLRRPRKALTGMDARSPPPAVLRYSFAATD